MNHTDRTGTVGHASSPSIVSGGRNRAVKEILKARKPEIRRLVEEKYADRLATAGAMRRIWIRFLIRREVKRRLADEVRQSAPSGGLYGMHS
jgi:hypothetical protein